MVVTPKKKVPVFYFVCIGEPCTALRAVISSALRAGGDLVDLLHKHNCTKLYCCTDV